MRKAICKIVHSISNKLGSKITVQLLLIFFFCTLVSLLIYNVSMSFVRNAIKEHDQKSEKMLIDGYNLSLAMQNEDLNSRDIEKIKSLIDSFMKGKSYNILLTDQAGKILYSSSDDPADIPSMAIKLDGAPADDTTIMIDMPLYAIKLEDTILQLSIRSSKEAGWIVKYGTNGVIPGMAALLSILIFILLFLLLSKKKLYYIAEIVSGIKTISKGNLDYRIFVKGNNELATLAKEINYMTGELKAYFEREKNREKSKAEFMLSLSHDLKSPLTALICYLSLLKDKEYETDEAMTDYIERAYLKSLRLKGLLQELLDFASLSSDDIKLDKQKISLKHMLEQLISEYTGILIQNDLNIISELSDDNVYADIDPNYMIRVFENLFSNALRYSLKPGEIRITLKKQHDSVMFSISNECKSIENEDLCLLFDKFYRVEKSRSEETGGTGLGLAIAKRIIELHDGKIWADYVNGKITFWVMLPVKD